VVSKSHLATAALIYALAGAAQAQGQQSYWRVDLGASKSVGADIRDKDPADLIITSGGPGNPTPSSLDGLGAGFFVSGGYGVRLRPEMRGEVTLGYRSYKLDAADGSSTTFKADITSIVLMANGYYEIGSGTWRPYVGAGLGFAQNKFGSFTTEGPAGSFTGPSGTKTGFAWALMAGAGVPLSEKRTLDFGYRYIDLGKIETSSGELVDNSPTGAPAPTNGLTGNLRAHELFVGLRF
jgi:opacity protein-like surface antigen